jgi:hypothetical protein
MATSPARVRKRELATAHLESTGHPRFDLLYSTVVDRCADFAKDRKTVKRRATVAAVGTAGGSGVTTLILGLRETFESVGPELVTAAFVLSAAGTLLTVWDRLFKHSALWVQRTYVLNALQRLRLDMEMYAVGRDPQQINDSDVEGFLVRLHFIDRGDMDSWLQIRSDIMSADDVRRVELTTPDEATATG